MSIKAFYYFCLFNWLKEIFMKKLLWLLFCSFGVIITSTAQQQVWEKPGGYQIRQIVSIANKIFYVPHGETLYVTSGNQNSALALGEFSNISNLTVFGNKVIFSCVIDGNFNIWITDGTVDGTSKISDFSGGNFTIFKNNLYFTRGGSIYYLDPTQTSAIELLTIPQNPPIYRDILFLKSVGDKLIYYFYGQLGISDGSSSAINFLSGVESAYPTVEVVNNKLFFLNITTDTGYELWSTDGTDANTGLLKDINAGTSNSFEEENHNLIPSFTSSNGKLYFVANKGTGKSVWVTDGTLNGTAELNIGANYYNPVSLKSIDGNVYFSNNYANGFYFSDGLNNTVQNIGGSQNPYDSYSFTKFNDSVYFVAYDDVHGYELWKTGNTASSTVRVTDICEGDCSAFNHFTGLTACGNILFFSASTIDYGFYENGNPYGPEYQLWKLEGSSAPTSILSNNINSVKFYPNPCQDYIYIELEEPVSSIKIASATGNIVLASWKKEKNNVIVNTQDLNPGIYMVLIDGRESIKIIKQ
jgi:hypothetical protein